MEPSEWVIPKSVGQLPMHYNHKPSAQSQDYLSMDIKPLFAFGFGLSYTQFKYDVPVLEKEKQEFRNQQESL